jgi:hypothetical protein
MRPVRPLAATFAFLLILLPLGDKALALATSTRVIPSYSWGNRTYTCLDIDGGQVPIPVPPVGGPVIQGGDSITLTWPKDGTVAVIRSASKPEAALADLMDQKEAPDAWAKYIKSTLKGAGYTSTVHDFQPNCLNVNHWKIGAITMDYALGGRKSSSLLMIWRTKDGSTLTVTMQSDPAVFKTHNTDLFALIGGSLVIPASK